MLSRRRRLRARFAARRIRPRLCGSAGARPSDRRARLRRDALFARRFRDVGGSHGHRSGNQGPCRRPRRAVERRGATCTPHLGAVPFWVGGIARTVRADVVACRGISGSGGRMTVLRYSVVVPTRDRNDLLALCLGRLAPDAQTTPAEQYEVIVTDDSATEA